MEDKQKDLIIGKTQELLEKLEITAQVDLEEQNDEAVVVIESEDAGILIGHHGRSLEAIQTLLRQIVFKETNEWVPFAVTVGDYREKRVEQLQTLAHNAAQRVIESQEPVSLPNLNPSERRVVHMALADHDQVASESYGEGRNRTLVIKPKT